jgi:plastocyanin
MATMTAAATLAFAAPIVGQMTHPGGGTTAHEVAINDAGYAPATMVAAPGQQVTWTNGGINPHTVTSDVAAFDSGIVQPKGKFTLTAPAASGSYTYHCTLHVFMRGNLVVSTVTLQAPKKAIVAGKTASVRGAVPGGVAGTPVTVESFASGVWTPIATTSLAADGTFSFRTSKLTKSLSLRAVIGADISPTADVAVAPRVVAKRAKAKLTLAVTVTPKRAGKAKLERLNLNTFRWTSVRNVRITRAGKATVKVPKAGSYRVTVLATKTLAAGSSPTVRFR